MEMYKSYLKERSDIELVTSEHGFATYETFFSETGLDCYIQDIYVVPEARRGRAASRLADKITIIAIELGCDRLLGSVDLKASNPTQSIKVLLRYGFEVFKSETDFIWFKKNIGDLNGK